jgi:hypothetical protein
VFPVDTNTISALDIQKILTNLNLYIDAELGVVTEQHSIIPVGESLESEFITTAMDESDPFSTTHDDDTEASS